MEYYDLWKECANRVAELEAENARLRADLERLIDAIMGEAEQCPTS